MQISGGISISGGVAVTPPPTVSGAPTIGLATATGATTATVTFTAPTNNGGAAITSYTATSSPGGITGTLSQAGSGTITVTGLTTGQAYTFTVTATNSAGISSASSASNSVTPILIAKLYVWGQNVRGQLGLGNTTLQNTPVQLGSDTNWNIISMGYRFSGAVKQNGTLWTWGQNDYGQLGLSDKTDRSSPTQVGSETYWTNAACGGTHVLITKSDGTLWTFGYNFRGTLGLSAVTTSKSSPVQIGSDTTWSNSKLAAGSAFSHVIKSDGTLWTWGYNTAGVLGLSSNNVGSGGDNGMSSPAQVGAMTNWSKIAASAGGAHAAAIKTDGTLWTWGRNQYGQLGLGDSGSGSDRNSPCQVGAMTNWADAKCGQAHTVALKTDGTLWTFGYNKQYQLGTNDTSYRSSPTQVGALSTWSKIATNGYAVYAIKTDGTLWTFGYNYYGELGIGTNGPGTKVISPVQVGSSTLWSTAGSGGYSSAMAISG